MRGHRLWMITLMVLLAATACKEPPGPLQPAAPPGSDEVAAIVAKMDPCQALNVDLLRNSDQSFSVIARIRDPDNHQCIGYSAAVPTIQVARGVAGTPKAYGDGVFVSVITPDLARTGEYPIKVSAQVGSKQLSQSLTALVFHDVHARWGQPRSVQGAVNTRGWEDSPFITPDGEYLLIMYLPISPSCVLEGNNKQPHCRKVKGAMDEKLRPGFASQFVGERVNVATGNISFDCLEVGSIYSRSLFERYSVYTPPMISFGFKRQPDGSYAQPFPIGITGASGCVAPSGLAIAPKKDGSFTAVMGLVDPGSWNTDEETNYPDLFTANIQLGTPQKLAKWSQKSKNLSSSDTGLRLIFGSTMEGRQDNPHPVTLPGSDQIAGLLWDREHEDEDIYFRLLAPGGEFPAGPWQDIQKVPVFSDRSKKEIQPWFDGKTMAVTRRYEVVSRQFHGQSLAEMAATTAWGPEQIELAVDNRLKGTEVGVLHAVGDATFAQRKGKTLLFFVYMLRGADGELDLNIGYVEETVTL
jgi:hypothetical protein